MKNKSLLSKLLTLFLVLGTTQLCIAQTNLATGKTTSATDGTDHANGVDGNAGTRWGSNFASISPDTAMFYTIDFDTLVYIDSINYIPFNDRILTYTIECSFDGVTFYDVSDQRGNIEGGALVGKAFDAAWMKYLRFSYVKGDKNTTVIADPSNPYGVYTDVYASIWEYGAFGSDDTPDSPDAFTLNDVTDADVSTTYTSNSITISGLTDMAPAIVLSDDSVKFSVNGGTYSNVVDTVVNGDMITVQLTTSNQYSTEFIATLFVGGVVDTFKVTTGVAADFPDAFTITDVSDANLYGEYISEAFTVSGLTNTATISITSTEEDAAYSINDGEFTSIAGDVSSGDEVRVRLVSGGLYEINHTVTVDINSITDVFDVTTKALVLNAGTNLALNQPAYDSNDQSPENAVDGDDGTRWTNTLWENPANYLVIDLGSSQSINEIEMTPYSQRDYQFVIKGSLDSASFFVISDESDNREGAASIIKKTFDTVTTRYVIFEFSGAALYGGPYTSFHEIRVFGDVPTNLTAKDISSNEASLYPNPVVDQLNISSEVAVKNVSIYTINGQLVQSSPITGSAVDVSGLKEGYYMTRLDFVDGTQQVSRIVKL